MAQLSPSTALYSQIIAKVSDLIRRYEIGDLKDYDEVASEIQLIISYMERNGAKPLLSYERIASGEPPQSEKFNEFVRNLEYDVNIMREQVDLSRAASISLHNFITLEVERAKNQNAQIAGKIKTLQLYSQSQNENQIIFGDSFLDLSLVDFSKLERNRRPTLVTPGAVSLGVSNEDPTSLDRSSVEVIDSFSNGIKGINQEVAQTSTDTTDIGVVGQEIVFKAETDRRAELDSITDGMPSI